MTEMGRTLGNHDQAIRVVSVDDIPRIDLADANAAVDWGDDARVIELHLRIVDGRLVGLHGGVQLIVGGFLRVKIRLREDFRFDQSRVPF